MSEEHVCEDTRPVRPPRRVVVPPPAQFPPVPKIVGHMNPKKNPKCVRQKNNLKYNDGRLLRLNVIRGAFQNLAQLTKSDRNHSILDPYQIYIVKRARHEHHTPKELEEMTGLSAYRIHQIVNMDTPPHSPDPAKDEHSDTESDDIAIISDILKDQAVITVPGTPIEDLIKDQ